MPKKTEECHCDECDSKFKIIYNEEDVSRYHTFCPFCGEELRFDEEPEETDREDDDTEYDD